MNTVFHATILAVRETSTVSLQFTSGCYRLQESCHIAFVMGDIKIAITAVG